MFRKKLSPAVREVVRLLNECPEQWQDLFDPHYVHVLRGPLNIQIREYRYEGSAFFVTVAGDELWLETKAEKHAIAVAVRRWVDWDRKPRIEAAVAKERGRVARIEQHLGLGDA